MMTKRLTAVFFLSAMMSFLCWSVVSYITKKAGDFLEPESDEVPAEVIDWAALYPFSGDEALHEAIHEEQLPKESLFDFVKRRCEDYTSEKLLGYHGIIEAARTYENLIGWNVARIIEYNGVVKLRDGYLTSLTDSARGGGQYHV